VELRHGAHLGRRRLTHRRFQLTTLRLHGGREHLSGEPTGALPLLKSVAAQDVRNVRQVLGRPNRARTE
jgi:hypothetical protein